MASPTSVAVQSVTSLPSGSIRSRSAGVPTLGTFNLGDIVLEASPVAGGAWAYLCVAAGTPGQWVALISDGTVI